MFEIGGLRKEDSSDLLRLALLQGIEDSDFVSEIFEVTSIGGPGFGMSLETAYFLNEAAEVVQGANRQQRGIVRIAIQAANGAENKSVFDDVERNAALVKSGGQEAVLAMDEAGGCRCLAVSGEHAPDVMVLGDVHNRGSALRIAQRRTIDIDGVAVMAETAQERIHHVAIAEEVGPFVVP